jgi:hypothetical protein
MAPGGVLEPEHAVVLQDRDVLQIPLRLDLLPTARAFRNAIQSLSPEQQR